MAIRKSQTIVIQVFGDGTSVSFSIDLATNPYFIVHNLAQPATLTNWFSDKTTAAAPTTINNDGTFSELQGNITASLSGTVLTVTYPTPLPLRTPDRVTVILVW